MTISVRPASITVPELALRILALRGTAAYVAYLSIREEVPIILADCHEELVALDGSANIAVLDAVRASDLLGKLAQTDEEIVLVSTTHYGAEDWELVDRRRSSLAHAGVMVFVMAGEDFDVLMRAAPNLASWLGALVFQRGYDASELAGVRERRLAALRSWAHKSDDDVVRDALGGALPADPEYAEWLVLLGRGDLLDRVK
jgi:hypothetical protein